MKKRPIFSVIENIKTDLQSNQENVDKYLQTQRLANIGKMVGGISHAFNNILGGILGYSQLLKEELNQKSTPYKHAAIIEKAAKRASKLISQLYMYSNSKHNYHKIPINPRVIVEEIVAILTSTYNRNIKISTTFKHKSQNVLADFPSMCQALMNICLNAKDAMQNGGELHIQTQVTDYDEIEGLTENAKKTKYLVFSIKDTGIGIKDEFIPHIFKPYFSTKETSLGNGFGLTVADGIVKEHQGFINVSSELEKGTTIKIYLPTTKESAVVQKILKKQEKVQGDGEVILVVDDEQDIREMTKKILERKGFRVLLADSGYDALKVFEENKKTIQLVILDLILPGLDGSKVYQKLKKKRAKPKFILTSGYTRISQNQKTIKITSNDCFLPKPWELPILIKEVRRLLKEA